MAGLTGRFVADFPHYSPDQLFALAVDIERYPAFIPWCRRAAILSRQGDVLLVDNHFGAGPVDAAFRTQARPRPPECLEITSSDTPFRAFRLVWHFVPLADGGCRVEADYSITLRSPLLQALVRVVLPEAERKIARRFRDRADALYG